MARTMPACYVSGLSHNDFSVEAFSVPGIGGGGWLVVPLYGDASISMGHVSFGVLEDETAQEAALDACVAQATHMTEKCLLLNNVETKVGGCAIQLYFTSEQEDTPTNRRRLMEALAKQLCFSLLYTNVLCLPGQNCTWTDLSYLRKAYLAYVAKSTTSGPTGAGTASMEGVLASSPPRLLPPIAAAASSSPPSTPRRRRSGSFSVQAAAQALDVPVPAAALMDGTSKSSIPPLVQAAAWSAWGALQTLMEAKQFGPNVHMVLVGWTPVVQAMIPLWEGQGYTNWMVTTEDDDDNMDDIPSDRLLPWTNWTLSCDLLIVATTHKPSMVWTVDVVDRLQCRACVSLSQGLLPRQEAEREPLRAQLLEKQGIFEFVDGLMDVGQLAQLYALAKASKEQQQQQQQQTSGGAPPPVVPSSSLYTKKQLEDLGRTVMNKRLHLDGIVKEYDIEDKRKFYSMVLADQVDDLGGLKLGLGTIIHNSSDSMTSWMWNRAKALCPAYRALQSTRNSKKQDIYYIDLGAGNGAAARWICKQHKRIHVKCINISPQQNSENRLLSDEAGLGGQVSVETMSFEHLPPGYSNAFDGVISQDAFIHAYSKLDVLKEAFRVTKGGGWLMVSDLVCGQEGDDLRVEELESFAQKNNVQNWVTGSQYVALAQEAGWSQVDFIDCTAQIKVSLQGLLNKIVSIINSKTHKGLNLKLLQTHRLSLSNRIGQIDRGVFQWGIIAARKPYDVVFLKPAPAVPDPHPMMSYSTNQLDGALRYGTDVVVLNIKDQMKREAILALPSTVRMIVTMSAGLDHIDLEAATERGIRVRRAARFQIVKSVADYLLSNIIFGLRNGFQNVGVPFPGKSWDLSWNSDGVDLDRAKIGFIGMGAIADETCRRIRALSTECELVYHIPSGIRCRFEEGTYRTTAVGIADLYSTCDVVIPMVPLTAKTAHLVDYKAFSMMKKTCIFINMARGKVVDTEGMLRALKEGLIRHAILDTTEPEPLPKDHDLWTLKNCTITPHFATNTTYVRKELVEDIPNEIEDTLDERGILRLEEERARKELSDAYRITREFGMDELVWNHLSVLLSDGSYLITPGNRMFDDIGPQDLVKSSGNVTADIIHDAVYKTREDVKAIVHLHTPATVAVSCLEMGFVPLAQEAAPFYGRVARHAWHGVSNEWEEQAMLGDAVKDRNINTLIMENHGFCTFGKTLGEAWVLAYYFDKACQTQLNCLQTGAKIKVPDPKVMEKAAEQSLLPEFLPGNCEWEALRKMLTRRGGRR